VTIASSLDGAAGNDTLTGGVAADLINGGDGSDTFVFTSDTTQDDVAGASAVSGVVINLSASAISSTDVFVAMANNYLTSTQSSVASNTATYLFNAESNTNASVIDTLTSIENATGTDLADYIVGSSSTNILVGGDGADKLDGGAGNDYLDSSTGNDIDTIIGGAGNDTFVLSDALEADVWVEAASGGTDTIYVGSDLSLAGYSFGVTIAAAAADASLAQFEQVALGAGVDVVFNSAQVTGLTLGFAEAAAGTSTVTVNASATTSTINLSGFSFNPETYTASTGTATALSAMTSGTDLIYINGGTGVNAITGTSYGDVITAGTGIDTVNISSGGADVVVLNDDTAGNESVITGFAIANDKIGIDESEFATINFVNTGAGTASGTALNAGDYNEIAATGQLVVDTVNIITTAAGYADFNTAFADVTDGVAGESIIGFYNSTSAMFELYFTATTANSDEVLIGQIDIVGANVASLSQSNFVVI